MRWQFRVTEVNKPHGLTLQAWGDFNGRGIWKFVQNGSLVDITFDWKVIADKPLLRRMRWLLQPIFSANHAWAMRKGEESLRIELLRRASTSGREVPPPPGPTFPHNLFYPKQVTRRL